MYLLGIGAGQVAHQVLTPQHESKLEVGQTLKAQCGAVCGLLLSQQKSSLLKTMHACPVHGAVCAPSALMKSSVQSLHSPPSAPFMLVYMLPHN